MVNLKFVRITDRYLGIILCYLLYYIHKIIEAIKGEKEKQQANKILIIKFWGVGNLIMMLPTIKAVRKHYPKAQIDIITLFQNEDAVKHNHFISNKYFISNKNVFRFIITYIRNLIMLKKEKYDIILDFEQFAKTSSVLALLIGGRERIGFDTPGQGRGVAYTRRVAYLDYTHMVETFFRIAKGAGVTEADLSPVKLYIPDQDSGKIKSFLEDNNIEKNDVIIGVHIGSGDNMLTQRRWEKEKFAQLADILIEKHKAKIIFTGVGEDEARLIEQTLSLMKNNAVNAANKFTLKELAALIEKCSFFISNDTAPVHIASAMGTPVVAFYGPNTPYLYGPRGKNNLVFYNDLYCSPCITNYNAKIHKCKNPICIESITVKEVLEGIEKKYLAKTPNETDLQNISKGE